MLAQQLSKLYGRKRLQTPVAEASWCSLGLRIVGAKPMVSFHHYGNLMSPISLLFVLRGRSRRRGLLSALYFTCSLSFPRATSCTLFWRVYSTV